jgi:hypothetical protein
MGRRSAALFGCTLWISSMLVTTFAILLCLKVDDGAVLEWVGVDSNCIISVRLSFRASNDDTSHNKQRTSSFVKCDYNESICFKFNSR